MKKYTSDEMFDKIIDLAQRISRPPEGPIISSREVNKGHVFIERFMETIHTSFHDKSNSPMAMLLKYLSLLEQKYAAMQTPKVLIHVICSANRNAPKTSFYDKDLEDYTSFNDDTRCINVKYAESVLAGFRKTNPEVSKIVDDLMNCVHKMNTMEDEVEPLKAKILSDVTYLRTSKEKLETAEKNLKSYTRKGATKQVLYSFNKAFNEARHVYEQLRRKYMKTKTK